MIDIVLIDAMEFLLTRSRKLNTAPLRQFYKQYLELWEFRVTAVTNLDFLGCLLVLNLV